MIILISGPIAVGKTALAGCLSTRLDGEVVRVRSALAEILGTTTSDRQRLQVEGAELDRRTQGRWLVDYLDQRRELLDHLIVDSIRTVRQALPILERSPDSDLIYLEAHEETRRQRYQQAAQTDPVKASSSYDVAMHHPTEQGVVKLRPLAAQIIETDKLSTRQVCDEAYSTLVRPD